MSKTFLKVCPNCDTKKRKGERYCRTCGYDFEKNKLYDVEEDCRQTNSMVRKYINKQNRKNMMSSINKTIVFLSVCSAAYVIYKNRYFLRNKFGLYY